MKISLNNKILPILLTAGLLYPTKISKNQNCQNHEIANVIQTYNYTDVLNNPQFILQGLETQNDTNFVGGITNRFTDKSIEILKSRISKPQNEITYVEPIENNDNVYTEPFGYYFANRPGNRPHLGLDIFVTPLSRKPKKPVVVQSPIDGVVIAQKKARANDNVISNAITILGVDGRRYLLDHLARETDYDTHIDLPKVGTIIRKKDKIGYVGSTGETSLWHLHILVMTDEQVEKQKNDKMWQKLSSNNYCPLRGQVNPLSPEDAGPIALELLKYKGTKENAKGSWQENNKATKKKKTK